MADTAEDPPDCPPADGPISTKAHHSPSKNACTASLVFITRSFKKLFLTVLTADLPVTELMSRKPTTTTTTTSPHKSESKSKHKAATDPTTATNNADFRNVRDGLLPYTLHPLSFPASRVIYHSESWVLIRDLYPKASVHLLLLPRDPAINNLHPLDALSSHPSFLADAKREVVRAKQIAAAELRRLYGRDSAQDRERDEAREEAMRGAEATDTEIDMAALPAGRDWGAELLVGVHAAPSMNHVHIHILSADRVSECSRHRSHYNSFSTLFLVGLEEFPLQDGDKRLRSGWEGRGSYLDWDLECWRCGKGYGNKFKRFKEHLEDELQAWKKI